MKVKLILESLPVEGDKEHVVRTYPILRTTTKKKKKKKKKSRAFYQYLESHNIENVQDTIQNKECPTNSQSKRQSVDSNHEKTQMLGLSDRDFKAAIIRVHCEGKMGTLE